MYIYYFKFFLIIIWIFKAKHFIWVKFRSRQGWVTFKITLVAVFVSSNEFQSVENDFNF